MALWHGFKQYAVDLGLKIRTELGLSAFDRLDADKLADRYRVTVVSFDQVNCSPETLQHFTCNQWRSLSGFAIPVDGMMAVALNPSHTEARTRSTFTHEISHVVLNHESKVRLTRDDNCIYGDVDQEDEARWLGAELLLPREAAKRAVLRDITEDQVRERFGVSRELARWRMNICGGKNIRRRIGR